MMIKQTGGTGLRGCMNNLLLPPEVVVEDTTGGGEVMQGVMGQKNSGGRPGSPFFRPDDTVRKRNPHPVGTVFIFLVANPVKYDSRPFGLTDRHQRQDQLRGLCGGDPWPVADATHPPARDNKLFP